MREHIGDMTDEELAAIQGYSSQDYEALNKVLRDPNADPGKTAALKGYVDAVRSGLDKLPAFEGEVYRGTALSERNWRRVEAAYASGEPLSDLAFSSSSENADVAEEFLDRGRAHGKVPAFFTIQSRTGKQIEFLSKTANEAEVLFNAGAKFKVISIDEGNGPDGKPRKEVFLREVVDQQESRTEEPTSPLPTSDQTASRVEDRATIQQQGDRQANDAAQAGGKKAIEYTIKRSDLVVEVTAPAPGQSVNRWNIAFFANGPGGQDMLLGNAGVLLDSTGRPAGPTFVLDNRFQHDGKDYKARVVDDSGNPMSLTGIALDQGLKAFKETFGYEAENLGGSLADDNKLNFQRAFFEAEQGGLPPDEAKLAAIRSISYGKHRASRGYDNFAVRISDERVEVDLGKPHGKQRVPKKIEVDAMRW